VYVAADHACWRDEDYAQRVRKNKFGKVKKSDVIGLNRMLAYHGQEARDWVLENLGEKTSRAESGSAGGVET
jgi:histone deacetylase 6